MSWRFGVKESFLDAIREAQHSQKIREAMVKPTQGNYEECKDGIKHDLGKPNYALLSSIALHKIVSVLTLGTNKYPEHNWRKGLKYSRLIAAAFRHMFAWLGGESLDPESGMSHLAHASCCLMFLLELEDTRKDLDDRFIQENK
jgi:hypothetical protein